jgi:four helix bundle protein
MALKIYQDCIRLITNLRPVVREVARHDPDLARQMRRALSSVALNIAEGEHQRDGRARTHFGIAMGSANESRAALEIAEALGYIADQHDARDALDRIARSLRRLTR